MFILQATKRSFTTKRFGSRSNRRIILNCDFQNRSHRSAQLDWGSPDLSRRRLNFKCLFRIVTAVLCLTFYIISPLTLTKKSSNGLTMRFDRKVQVQKNHITEELIISVTVRKMPNLFWWFQLFTLSYEINWIKVTVSLWLDPLLESLTSRHTKSGDYARHIESRWHTALQSKNIKSFETFSTKTRNVKQTNKT